MTFRVAIIIAKCMAFPVYFITMPIIFIVGGVKQIVETWKMFIEFGKEELRSEVEE